MHGRTTLLPALVLAATIALPAGARADATQRVGPATLQQPDLGAQPCAGGCTTVALGAASPFDGVVVRWHVRTLAAEHVRLRTIQPMSSGRYAPTASGPQVDVTPGAERVFDARVPIAEGGLLALDGAQVPSARLSGASRTMVLVSASDGTAVPGTAAIAGTLQLAADVEPDADGDGYGDLTQDACPGDWVDHDAPCTATRTFGSALLLAPDSGGLSASGNPMDGVQLTPALGAPIGGVLTRWRWRAEPPSHTSRLQVLQPGTSAGAFTVRAASPAATPGAGNGVMSVDARLPVATGDRLGLSSAGDLDAVAVLPGDDLGLFPGAGPSPGQSAVATGGHALRLLVQADVEPDTDADGYGDVSQDTCPFDAARQTGCQADLRIDAQASQSVDPGHAAYYEVDAVNDGPDPAAGAVLQVTLPAGTDLGSLACPVTAGVATCRAPRLDPGQQLTLSFYATGDPGTVASTSATAGSATPDPDGANNAFSATTTFTDGPAQAQPPAVLADTPCHNLIRGGHDDDALRGTAFGDRLVGLDGRDFEQGLAGDDCLEGGAGGDVLDGGDGSDRLSGGTGDDRLGGGTGDDRLTGGLGDDRLSGGPGNDTLLPGRGHDIVAAGSGNDVIFARDGARDSIDCGAGRDTVRADRADHLRHCEHVSRR